MYLSENIEWYIEFELSCIHQKLKQIVWFSILNITLSQSKTWDEGQFLKNKDIFNWV